MDHKEALDKINEIARDVFDNEAVVLSDATTAADVEEWDSLTHLSLISDIEEAFGIHLTLREITGSRNVGELVDAVVRRVNGN